MTRLFTIFAVSLGIFLTVWSSAPAVAFATGYVTAAAEEDCCGDEENADGEEENGCGDCVFCSCCSASHHHFVASFLELPDPMQPTVESKPIVGPTQAHASGVPPGIFKPPRQLV